MKGIGKAVIPAAGLGTRFLPLTKAQPKEMIPVVDKPTIQYAVEEAVQSGINDILIITGRGKRAIEDHFDRSFELEATLREKNDLANLAELESIAQLAEIHYIRQKHPAGLGHAILCAAKHVGQESFAVLLGDIITDDPPSTCELVEAYNDVGTSIIAVEQVPMEKISSYGVIKGGHLGGGLYEVEDLIEKPSLDEAPSNLAVLGRYVLTPGIFAALERTPPGRGGEIQLTDGLKTLLDKERICALEVTGRRFDIGNKLDWLKATVELALADEEIGPELREFLKETVACREF
ncbi:MAG: UTP--glucose-1-phosphate uridylyltransferase GalU [Actinobacteria bacterium]|nr:UTP--glucose-1-phosphate uridylyltransferase GalU [Actinomycetota bacterium]